MRARTRARSDSYLLHLYLISRVLYLRSTRTLRDRTASIEAEKRGLLPPELPDAQPAVPGGTRLPNWPAGHAISTARTHPVGIGQEWPSSMAVGNAVKLSGLPLAAPNGAGWCQKHRTWQRGVATGASSSSSRLFDSVKVAKTAPGMDSSSAS